MSDSKSLKDNGGPRVKTGPTRGEVRSRNQDGTWRAKRSDAGKPRERKDTKDNKGGCFLTTAACDHRGLPDDCHELQVMRAFRDDILTGMPGGHAMIEAYYEIAPLLVPLLCNDAVADGVWRDIETTVAFIEAGQHAKAVSAYQQMVGSLVQSSPPTCVSMSGRAFSNLCNQGALSNVE